MNILINTNGPVLDFFKAKNWWLHTVLQRMLRIQSIDLREITGSVTGSWYNPRKTTRILILPTVPNFRKSYPTKTSRSGRIRIRQLASITSGFKWLNSKRYSFGKLAHTLVSYRLQYNARNAIVNHQEGDFTTPYLSHIFRDVLALIHLIGWCQAIGKIKIVFIIRVLSKQVGTTSYLNKSYFRKCSVG